MIHGEYVDGHAGMSRFQAIHEIAGKGRDTTPAGRICSNGSHAIPVLVGIALAEAFHRNIAGSPKFFDFGIFQHLSAFHCSSL
ncbi:hypothetical protein [Novosphingobium sp. EMRT-2]|uniref:hypothetical protein n=1 Tax=Novosphingobium sp. EMRT-2 TaxID=2571749 RepID=UPI002108369D|nr:hypothetical protein [Novosphingobium sp. EMRT-2]